MDDRMERLDSIDEFRGFAILLMVLVDYLAGPRIVPVWLKHVPDIGFTVADIVAPMFIVAIGLTFGLSYRSHLAHVGRRKAIWHFLTRYLALLGAGVLLTTLGNVSGFYVDQSGWGLLQAIGCAGLLTLPVIQIPARFRWIVGVILLTFYQVLLDRFWLARILGSTHGGPLGALSWAAMLILATSLGDFFHDSHGSHSRFPWLAGGILLLGLLLALIVPVSKNRVSASYVVISLGMSALLFWFFFLFDSQNHHPLPILRAWGRNSLALYLLHGGLLGVFVVSHAPGWYELAPWWLVLAQACCMIIVLSLVGLVLDRRHLYFSL